MKAFGSNSREQRSQSIFGLEKVGEIADNVVSCTRYLCTTTSRPVKAAHDAATNLRMAVSNVKQARFFGCL